MSLCPSGYAHLGLYMKSKRSSGNAIVYYNFDRSCCIAIIFISLSALTSGLTPSVHAKTTRTHTVRSSFQDSVDFLNRGCDRFQRKDYKGAIEDFNQAIVLNPYSAYIGTSLP